MSFNIQRDAMLLRRFNNRCGQSIDLRIVLHAPSHMHGEALKAAVRALLRESKCSRGRVDSSAAADTQAEGLRGLHSVLSWKIAELDANVTGFADGMEGCVRGVNGGFKRTKIHVTAEAVRHRIGHDFLRLTAL